MTGEVVDCLQRARELIASEDRWIQHHFATTWNDVVCTYDSELAEHWCALGAISKVTKGLDNRKAILDELDTVLATSVDQWEAVMETYSGTEEKMRLMEWNDTKGRKHSEVLTVFDKAIANAKAKALEAVDGIDA